MTVVIVPHAAVIAGTLHMLAEWYAAGVQYEYSMLTLHCTPETVPMKVLCIIDFEQRQSDTIIAFVCVLSSHDTNCFELRCFAAFTIPSLY